MLERLAKKKSFQFATISICTVFLLTITYQGTTIQGLDAPILNSGVDSTWAFQNQNQQNTGYSPQTIINNSNVGSLVSVWNISIGGLSSTPVVSNGIVYVCRLSNLGFKREHRKNNLVDGPHNRPRSTILCALALQLIKEFYFLAQITICSSP